MQQNTNSPSLHQLHPCVSFPYLPKFAIGSSNKKENTHTQMEIKNNFFESNAALANAYILTGMPLRYC